MIGFLARSVSGRKIGESDNGGFRSRSARSESSSGATVLTLGRYRAQRGEHWGSCHEDLQVDNQFPC